MQQRDFIYIPKAAFVLGALLLGALGLLPSVWLILYLKAPADNGMPDHVIAAIGSIQAIVTSLTLLIIAYFSTRGRSFKSIRDQIATFLHVEIPGQLRSIELDRWIDADVLVKPDDTINGKKVAVNIQRRAGQNYAFYAVNLRDDFLLVYLRVNVKSFSLILYLPVVQEAGCSLTDAQAGILSVLKPATESGQPQQRRKSDSTASNNIADAFRIRDDSPGITFPREVFRGGRFEHPAIEIEWQGNLPEHFLVDPLERLALGQDVKQCVLHVLNVADRGNLRLWSQALLQSTISAADDA